MRETGQLQYGGIMLDAPEGSNAQYNARLIGSVLMYATREWRGGAHRPRVGGASGSGLLQTDGRGPLWCPIHNSFLPLSLLPSPFPIHSAIFANNELVLCFLCHTQVWIYLSYCRGNHQPWSNMSCICEHMLDCSSCSHASLHSWIALLRKSFPTLHFSHSMHTHHSYSRYLSRNWPIDQISMHAYKSSGGFCRHPTYTPMNTHSYYHVNCPLQWLLCT